MKQTSPLDCLSHLPVSEPGGGIFGLRLSAIPEPLTGSAATDQRFAAKTAVTFAVEGRWQIFQVLKYAQNKHKSFTAKFRRKKNKISPLSGRDRDQIVPVSDFPSKISPRPEPPLPLPVSLALPLSQPL